MRFLTFFCVLGIALGVYKIPDDTCQMTRTEMKQKICKFEKILDRLMTLDNGKEDRDELLATAVNPRKRHKTAYQSSTYDQSVASLAIDHKWKSHGSACARTSLERKPWWKAVFKVPVKVSRIVIMSRKDCCAEQLYKLLVTVDGAVCARYRGPPRLGQVIHLQCKRPLPGRVVKIEREISEGILALCEVLIS